MSELKPFVFDESLVRVRTDEQGDPWFVAKDVCRVLDLGNVTEALRPLDDDEKITLSNSEGNPRAGVPHQINMVSESGLYALVFRSRKPEARRFRKWVTSEVLPSLRRSGAYGAPQAAAPEIQATARRVKPNLRATALHAAVQAAKMQGGGEDDVQRLFIQYCSWLASVQSGSARTGDTYSLVAEWASSCLEDSFDDGHRVRTLVLLDRFKAWLRDHGRNVEPPSVKAFAQVLGERFTAAKRNGFKWFYVRFLD